MLSLTVSALKVTTREGRTLVDVPALSAPAGTLLGVRGPSGAGKSTLLHALSGVMRAEGVVRWGETDLASLSAERRTAFRARHMGMIFQDFLLFDELSPAANAGLGALFAPKRQRDDVVARGQDRLTRLNVPADARSVASFSGGERQRVAISRALAGDPGILLADEPTAALDRASADRLIADLVGLTREAGKTFVAVSHDTHLLDAMDRVITIEDGRLREETAA